MDEIPLPTMMQLIRFLSGEKAIPPDWYQEFVRELTYRNYARSKALVWFTIVLAVGVFSGAATMQLSLFEVSPHAFLLWIQVFLIVSSGLFHHFSSVNDALTVPDLQSRHERLWYLYGIGLMIYANVMFYVIWVQSGLTTPYVVSIFVFAVFFYYPSTIGFLLFLLNTLFYFFCVTVVKTTVANPVIAIDFYRNNALVAGIVATVASWLFNRLLLESQLRDFRNRRKIEQQARELQEANDQLQRLASVDGLTQVSNRRFFDERLTHEWRRLARSGNPLSLILCDVDYFKRYNDTYGHLAGDACLQQIAKALQVSVRRPADVVARYGGEEFAIILPDTNAAGSLHVADTVLRQVASLKIAHRNSDVSDYVTISVGIATTIPSPSSNPTQLLSKADEALYAAKQNGRNSVVHQSLATTVI